MSGVGDKGQRFEVRYSDNEDGNGWQVLGWTNDKDHAERMCRSWRLRPSKPFVWFVDRQIEHGGDFCSADPQVPS